MAPFLILNREVEELGKRLQVAELKSGGVEKDFDMKNKENIQAVQSEQA